MRRVLVLILLAAAAEAQTTAPNQSTLTLSRVEKSRALPNGLSAAISGAALEITALRPDVLRVRISAAQARAFIQRANQVVAAGRPPCPFCGLPLDPSGHICPRQNGHRA